MTYTFQQNSRYIYVRVSDSLNRSDAQNFCATNLSTQLAVINNSSDYELAMSLIQTLSNTDSVWIGLNDIEKEGSFIWPSGKAPDFTNWGSGEPNNQGNEDCVQMYTSVSTDQGLWNDLPCSVKLDEFFCDNKQPPTTSPTNSPTSAPTKAPVPSPTTPTKIPTRSPSGYPTRSPSGYPTSIPSKFPTTAPSQPPTRSPSKPPTRSPSGFPSKPPTGSPSKPPTRSPTGYPSKPPTRSPSKHPTRSPTRSPSTNPSRVPTKSPTYAPINNIFEISTTENDSDSEEEDEFTHWWNNQSELTHQLIYAVGILLVVNIGIFGRIIFIVYRKFYNRHKHEEDNHKDSHKEEENSNNEDNADIPVVEIEFEEAEE